MIKLIFTFILLPLAAVAVAEDSAAVVDADGTIADTSQLVEVDDSVQFVVYYLHMNRRCMTCEKLEKYTDEAVATGFAEQLEDSTLLWRVLNFEEKGNEHYAEDYKLFSQSVIVSKLRDGEEVDWKNLDKIWKLVGNKEAFINCVQAEVRDFMTPPEKD
jgi:hypothetical protein